MNTFSPDPLNGTETTDTIDAIEVAACVYLSSIGAYERIASWDEAGADPIIFTVYGYRRHDREGVPGGAFAIGDFDDPDRAYNVGKAIANTAGIPLYNEIP